MEGGNPTLPFSESGRSGASAAPPMQYFHIGYPLRILVVSDPLLPIPPNGYGGTERIVFLLCQELARMGHHVDLMAGPDSRRFGGRLFVHRRPSMRRWSRFFRKAWFQVLSLLASRRADVVLNFGRLDYLVLLLLTGKPLVCRFGNPISQSDLNWLGRRRKRGIRFIGVSQSQIAGLRFSAPVHVVANAVDPGGIPFVSSPPCGSPLLFLGRLTANKGADAAIRISKRCGMKLKLAGNVPEEPGAREFFEEEIRPHLGADVEWLGAVDDTAKRTLLGNASALLFPIRWPEPFGIVMIESLAGGTPVIALRCASTPEVIEHGVTGFLCDSEDEMVAAVARIGEIDRGACRKAAEERFSAERMTKEYLKVIDQLLNEPL
jgi:glycosyltransferase involved in cell wall biosynthesis